MGAIQLVAGLVSAYFVGLVLLSDFGQFPVVVAEDAKLGYRDHFPHGLRIGPGYAFPRPWILHVGATIPLEATDVDCVVQDAGSTIDLTSDRCVAPLAAVRSRDAVGVQALSDRPSGFPRGELAEDAPNDRSLGVDYLPFPERPSTTLYP